jgi:hypothetical protein
MSELDDLVVRMRARAMTGSVNPSITCPVCGRTSYNPNDVVQRYCGNCHQFHDNMSPALLTSTGVTTSVPGVATGKSWRWIAMVGDVCSAASAIGFFVAAKLGASWWWLVFLIPLTVALLWSGRTLTQAVTRLREPRDERP